MNDEGGVVVAVARSREHGVYKPCCEEIRLVPGEGVEGDAHRGTTVKHRSLLLFVAVLLTSVGCDHATKQIARSTLDGVGAVTDFVSLGLGTLRTGIFNLADLEIVSGVVLVVAATWRSDRAPRSSLQ